MGAPMRSGFAALVVASFAVACSPGPAGPSPSATAPGFAVPAGAVPWANLPSGPVAPPTAYPSPPRPADARPCRAVDLVASQGFDGHATQTHLTTISLRNVSRSACLLSGYPRIAVSAPGQRTILGSPTSPWIDGSAMNQAPGASSVVDLVTSSDCPATGSSVSGSPYRNVVITTPGGGVVSIRLRDGIYPRPCSGGADAFLGVTPFEVPYPTPTYPPDPLTLLTAKVLAPTTAHANDVVTYVVRLTNTGEATEPLTPCPTYIQHGPPGVKEFYLLNCALAAPIPGHGFEDFIMRVHLPVSDHGPVPLCWELDDASQGAACSLVSVASDG